MIVWIGSYPRSGNTFFRLVLQHAFSMKSYASDNDRLIKQQGISEVIGYEPITMTLDEMDASPQVFLVKTHDILDDGRPAIYLVRDGRDTLVSYARFLSTLASAGKSWKIRAKKLLKLDDSSILLKHLVLPRIGEQGGHLRFSHPALIIRNTFLGDYRHTGWGNHVRGWMNRSGGAYLVRFEDLVKDPVKVVRDSLDTYGLLQDGKQAQELPSFEELHARWPKFFRRGQSGAWRDEMPKPVQEMFWKYHGQAMCDLGYDEDNHPSMVAPTTDRQETVKSRG